MYGVTAPQKADILGRDGSLTSQNMSYCTKGNTSHSSGSAYRALNSENIVWNVLPEVCTKRQRRRGCRSAGRLLEPMSSPPRRAITPLLRAPESPPTPKLLRLPEGGVALCPTSATGKPTQDGALLAGTAIKRRTCPRRQAGYHPQVWPGSIPSHRNTTSYDFSTFLYYVRIVVRTRTAARLVIYYGSVLKTSNQYVRLVPVRRDGIPLLVINSTVSLRTTLLLRPTYVVLIFLFHASRRFFFIAARGTYREPWYQVWHCPS